MKIETRNIRFILTVLFSAWALMSIATLSLQLGVKAGSQSCNQPEHAWLASETVTVSAETVMP